MTGRSPSTPQQETDVSAIAAIRHALEAAENAADADAAAALFTDDVVAMVPDFPVQEGRAACAAFMREIMCDLSAQFDRHITYVSAEVIVAGNMAFDRGTFSFTVTPKSGGRESRTAGKYLWLLTRAAADEWRLARLIVSRDSDDEGEAFPERHLELVTIVVHEYDPAIRFFVDVLGFELVEDSPAVTNDGRAKRWVVVRPPGAQTGVLLARADGERQEAIVGNQHGGRVGFFLRVEDFTAWSERMIAAGVHFVSPPRKEPYGEVAVFLDIAGNRWDLIGPA